MEEASAGKAPADHKEAFVNNPLDNSTHLADSKDQKKSRDNSFSRLRGLRSQLSVADITTAPCTIQWATKSAQVYENKGRVTAVLKRDGDPNVALDVVVYTVAETAVPGSNFGAINKLVCFQEGEIEKQIEIFIFDDPSDSGTMTFKVVIEVENDMLEKAAIGENAEFKVHILDTDNTCAERLRKSTAFGRLITFMTAFALFAHDIWILCKISKEYDNVLGWTTVVCFLTFVVEMGMKIMLRKMEYSLSAEFFLDICAVMGIFTLIRLTIEGVELDFSDILFGSGSVGVVARTARVARVGSRAGRATKVPKVLGQFVSFVIDLTLAIIRCRGACANGDAEKDDEQEGDQEDGDKADGKIKDLENGVEMDAMGKSKESENLKNEAKKTEAESSTKTTNPQLINAQGELGLTNAPGAYLQHFGRDVHDEIFKHDEETGRHQVDTAELILQPSKIGGYVLEVLTSKITCMMLLLLVVFTLLEVEMAALQKVQGLEMVVNAAKADANGTNGVVFSAVLNTYKEGNPEGVEYNGSPLLYLKINNTEFISDWSEVKSLRLGEMEFVATQGSCGNLLSLSDIEGSSCPNAAIFSLKDIVLQEAQNNLILTFLLAIVVTVGMGLIALDFHRLVFDPITRLKNVVWNAMHILFGDPEDDEPEEGGENDDDDDDDFNDFDDDEKLPGNDHGGDDDGLSSIYSLDSEMSIHEGDEMHFESKNSDVKSGEKSIVSIDGGPSLASPATASGEDAGGKGEPASSKDSKKEMENLLSPRAPDSGMGANSTPSPTGMPLLKNGNAPAIHRKLSAKKKRRNSSYKQDHKQNPPCPAADVERKVSVNSSSHVDKKKHGTKARSFIPKSLSTNSLVGSARSMVRRFSTASGLTSPTLEKKNKRPSFFESLDFFHNENLHAVEDEEWGVQEKEAFMKAREEFIESLKYKWDRLLSSITSALGDIEKALGMNTHKMHQLFQSLNGGVNELFYIESSMQKKIREGQFKWEWLAGELIAFMKRYMFGFESSFGFLKTLIQQDVFFRSVRIVLKVYGIRGVSKANLANITNNQVESIIRTILMKEIQVFTGLLLRRIPGLGVDMMEMEDALKNGKNSLVDKIDYAGNFLMSAMFQNVLKMKGVKEDHIHIPVDDYPKMKRTAEKIMIRHAKRALRKKLDLDEKSLRKIRTLEGLEEFVVLQANRKQMGSSSDGRRGSTTIYKVDPMKELGLPESMKELFLGTAEHPYVSILAPFFNLSSEDDLVYSSISSMLAAMRDSITNSLFAKKLGSKILRTLTFSILHQVASYIRDPNLKKALTKIARTKELRVRFWTILKRLFRHLDEDQNGSDAGDSKDKKEGKYSDAKGGLALASSRLKRRLGKRSHIKNALQKMRTLVSNPRYFSREQISASISLLRRLEAIERATDAFFTIWLEKFGFDFGQELWSTQTFVTKVVRKVVKMLEDIAEKNSIAFNPSKVLDLVRDQKKISYKLLATEFTKSLSETCLRKYKVPEEKIVFSHCASTSEVLDEMEGILVTVFGERLCNEGVFTSPEQFITIRNLAGLRHHVQNILRSQCLEEVRHKNWVHHPMETPSNLENRLRKVDVRRLSSRERMKYQRAMNLRNKLLEKVIIPERADHILRDFLIETHSPAVFLMPCISTDFFSVLGSPIDIIQNLFSKKEHLMDVMKTVLDVADQEEWIPPYVSKIYSANLKLIKTFDREVVTKLTKVVEHFEDNTLSVGHIQALLTSFFHPSKYPSSSRLPKIAQMVSSSLESVESILRTFVVEKERAESKERSISHITIGDMNTAVRSAAVKAVLKGAQKLKEFDIHLNPESIVNILTDQDIHIAELGPLCGTELTVQLFQNVAPLVLERKVEASEFKGCGTVASVLEKAELILVRHFTCIIEEQITLPEHKKKELEQSTTINGVRKFLKRFAKENLTEVGEAVAAGDLTWEEISKLASDREDMKNLLSLENKLPDAVGTMLKGVLDKSPSMSLIASIIGVGNPEDLLTASILKFRTGTMSFDDFKSGLEALNSFFTSNRTLMGAGVYGIPSLSMMQTTSEVLTHLERMMMMIMVNQNYIITKPSLDLATMEDFVRHVVSTRLKSGAELLNDHGIDIDFNSIKQTLLDKKRPIQSAISSCAVQVCSQVLQSVLKPYADVDRDDFKGCGSVSEVLEIAEKKTVSVIVSQLKKASTTNVIPSFTLSEENIREIEKCRNLKDLQRQCNRIRCEKLTQLLEEKGILNSKGDSEKGVKDEEKSWKILTWEEIRGKASANQEIQKMIEEATLFTLPVPQSASELVKSALKGSPLMDVVIPCIDSTEALTTYMRLITSNPDMVKIASDWFQETIEKSGYYSEDTRGKIKTFLEDFHNSKIMSTVTKYFDSRSKKWNFTQLRMAIEKIVESNEEKG